MANVEQFQNEAPLVTQRTGLLATSSNALSRVREAIDQPGFRRAFPTLLATLTAVAAIVLYLGMQKAEMTTLYSSLSENEKSQVLNSLRNMGVAVQLDPATGEILVPTESVVELKSGAKKKTERKFFPGYILIEMEMNDDTWQLVKHTPRVSSFVGGKKDKPSPISKSDVDNILNRIEVGEEAPRPKTLFEPGEVIRVCDGPFNDFNGIVEEVDYERSSVKVSVQILGRSTPVQLDFIQIEKT